MEKAEIAEKMLQAINKEYREGKMPEEVYNILLERWGGVPEEIAEEEIEEVPTKRRLPPHAGPEDMDTFVGGLLKDITNLKGEIVELEVEKETTVGTLKGLERKLSAGAIEKSRFGKISRQYASKIKGIDAEIAKKQAQIGSIHRRLARMKAEIQRKISAYTQVLRKLEKVTKV